MKTTLNKQTEGKIEAVALVSFFLILFVFVVFFGR
jgi:hypothetical protein